MDSLGGSTFPNSDCGLGDSSAFGSPSFDILSGFDITGHHSSEHGLLGHHSWESDISTIFGYEDSRPDNSGFTDGANGEHHPSGLHQAGHDHAIFHRFGRSAQLPRQERPKIIEPPQYLKSRPRLIGNKFRLIKLSPWSERSTLTLSILQYDSFDTCPPYTALSWTWGTHIGSKTVRLANMRSVELLIRRNCYNALYNLSQQGDELYIWIDQLCINQEDPREKAHQVAMMGLIYWHAKEIVAYVGETDEVSRHIFSKAAELEAEANVNGEIVATREAQGQLIAEFMERPWFHRVWIIQETLLARRITVRAGDQTMSWNTFAALYESTHAGHSPPVCPPDDKYVPSLAIHSNLIEIRQWYLSHFQNEQDAHRSAKMTEPFSSHIFKFAEFGEVPSTGVLDYSRFFDVLRATWHFDATVKRDKLFAVFSLFEGSVPPELEPDYVKSEKQVWQDLRGFLTRKCGTSSDDVDKLLGTDEDEFQENVAEESVVEDSTSPPEEKSKPLPIISPPETKVPRTSTRFKVLGRMNPFRHVKHG